MLGTRNSVLGTAVLVDRTLTLEDSVRLAVNNSPELLSAREDVHIAQQRIREAQSLFFPKLDLNANWSKFDVDSGVPLMLQPGLGMTLLGDSDRENFYTARANILQSVYEGGRSRNIWRQARISFERARSANESLRGEMTARGKKAFFDLLYAQESRKQIDQLVERLRPAAGRGGPGGWVEQARTESLWQRLRARASEAAREYDRARLAFLEALNLELPTTVVLKGELATQPVDLELQKLLAWSRQYRSELRQTEYQQELDALGVALSLAERKPTVAFGASYERRGPDIGLETSSWAGTLNVNLPISISDMVYGWAKVREHRAQYRQATLRHAETADQIERQVRQSYTDYRHWQDELGPREEGYRRLRQLIEEAPSRERLPPAERLDLEQRLLESRLRFLEAIHGHLTALASLERAVGHPLGGEQ